MNHVGNFITYVIGIATGLFICFCIPCKVTHVTVPFPITISPDAPRSTPNEIPIFKSCEIQWKAVTIYSLRCEVK